MDKNLPNVFSASSEEARGKQEQKFQTLHSEQCQVIDLISEKLKQLIVHDSTEQELKDTVSLLDELRLRVNISETSQSTHQRNLKYEIIHSQSRNKMLQEKLEYTESVLATTQNELALAKAEIALREQNFIIPAPNKNSKWGSFIRILGEIGRNAPKEHKYSKPAVPNLKCNHLDYSSSYHFVDPQIDFKDSIYDFRNTTEAEIKLMELHALREGIATWDDSGSMSSINTRHTIKYFDIILNRTIHTKP